MNCMCLSRLVALGALLVVFALGSFAAVAGAVELHVAHGGGVSYFDYDGSSYTPGGFIGIGGINSVFADSSQNIHVGHGGGLSALDYTGASYVDASPSGAFFGLAGAAAMDQDAGGVLHVQHGGGLSDFSFSDATGYSSSGAYINVPSGGDIEVGNDGTVHAGHPGGASALGFSPGSYADNAYFGGVNPTNHVVEDSNGVLHYGINNAGVAGLNYAGGYADTGAFIALGPGGAQQMDIDSGDIIHVADNNGISALQFNGTSYTGVGFFALGGISEVFVDSNDHIHAAHGGGLSAFTHNGSSYTPGAYFNVGGVVDITQTIIPEPSSACLILVGALVGVSRRRRSK